MEGEKKNPHEGHRRRLWHQYRERGLEGMTEVQILELVLNFTIPRRDTNPIAHGLLERFGTLPEIMNASEEQLCKVPGITPAAARLLHLIPDLWRHSEIVRQRCRVVFETTDQCGEYLQPYFAGLETEKTYIMCLDGACRLISVLEVGQGTVNFSSVPLRRIVETALSLNASCVVLAHNHPAGIALPSTEDVHITERLRAALDGVNILLLDHLILVEDDFVSLRDSGLIATYPEERFPIPFHPEQPHRRWRDRDEDPF